jgi:hypothetical protein
MDDCHQKRPIDRMQVKNLSTRCLSISFRTQAPPHLIVLKEGPCESGKHAIFALNAALTIAAGHHLVFLRVLTVQLSSRPKRTRRMG